ncbi:MAG TPA: C45 family peptidase [Rhizobiaceae bacterium]|nr:C45 family peptidase [Rhizobiaceae bacterium]
MTKPKSFPFVSVSGKPYERGRLYGAAVADRVRLSAELYGGTLDELGYRGAERRTLIEGFAHQIESVGVHYVEEMRGIADGAGVEFADIVMINARTEVVAKARRERGVTARREPEEGCTGIIVLAPRSKTGSLLHAQNWDWRAECAETGIVLRVHRDDGPDFLTFVEAGGLARSGLNEAGIAITANYLESDRDFRQEGVPLALIRRMVLEQSHFAFAVKAVATTPKACSNNMMISTVEGFGIDFECAPDEAFSLYPDRELIVHANHWVSPVALAKLKDTGIANTPDSVYRDWRVRRLLDEAGEKIGTADIKQALFDGFATPYSVCRPPRPSSNSNLSATVAMVVIEPGEGTMEVAPLPALQREFTQYSLHKDPVVLAA